MQFGSPPLFRRGFVILLGGLRIVRCSTAGPRRVAGRRLSVGRCVGLKRGLQLLVICGIAPVAVDSPLRHLGSNLLTGIGSGCHVSSVLPISFCAQTLLTALIYSVDNQAEHHADHHEKENTSALAQARGIRRRGMQFNSTRAFHALCGIRICGIHCFSSRGLVSFEPPVVIEGAGIGVGTPSCSGTTFA